MKRHNTVLFDHRMHDKKDKMRPTLKYISVQRYRETFTNELLRLFKTCLFFKGVIHLLAKF